ncbi:MAG: HupE/UreJ family protein [Gammaproteobacteria bacterium]
MNLPPRTKTLISLMLLLAAGSASAHPGHGDTGLVNGLMHPLLGLDHWLAMLGLGVWSRVAGMPAKAFGAVAVSLCVGAFAPLALPAVEPLLATSVLAAGLMGVAAASLPAWLGLGMAAAFALVHGHAHGHEMADAAAAAGAIGMSLVLMALGWLAGRSGAVRKAAPALLTLAGTGMLALA